MTIQTVKLETLEPPSANPRSNMDARALEGLAESLKTDGVLQNLVVVQGRGRKFRIISGERRYRALQLLAARGDIGPDYEVPVEVRKLTAADAHRIATVENVQREQLSPLDEATAFAKLIRKNVSIEDIAAQTGTTLQTIRQRLSLLDLHEDAQTALREDRITLAQARALTCGSAEQQTRIMEVLDRCSDWSPAEIREELLDDKPSLAEAIFDPETYTGTLTTDLFSDDENTYFDDEDQFFALQYKAVEALAEDKRQAGADFVDITDDHRIREWLYEKPEDGAAGGVVINLSPSGRVDVLENVARTVEPEQQDAATEKAKPKPLYSTPLLRIMAWHKTTALQAALLDSPATSLRLTAAALLCGSMRIHEALRAFHMDGRTSPAYDAINARCAELHAVLTEAGVDLRAISDDCPGWEALSSSQPDPGDTFDALQRVTEADLHHVVQLAMVVSFGQSGCDRLDTDSGRVFNRLAVELGVAMRQWWTPDEEFLSRRTRDQIDVILSDLGSTPSAFRAFTKAKLVETLALRFADARGKKKPDASDQSANDWLPGAMHFPAVDEAQDAEVGAASE